MVKFKTIRYPNLKTNHGFSMFELMVTLFIFTILGGGLFAVSLVGESSWQTNQVRIELQQESRKAMEALVFDLREAGPSSIDVDNDGVPVSSITFELPTAAGVVSGSIDWDDINPVQYVLGGANSDQLQRIVNSQPKVVATSLQSVQFTRQSVTPQILEVALVFQKDTAKGLSMTHNLNFNIQLRN